MKLYIFDSHEKTAYQYYMCVVIAENVDEAIEIIKKECEKNKKLAEEAHKNKLNPYIYQPDDLIPRKDNDPYFSELKEFQEVEWGTIIPRLIYDLPEGYEKGFILYIWLSGRIKIKKMFS